MSIKTRIALATALVALTTSVALAQDFDPNLANRYPAYADPIGSHVVMRSAPVRLQSRSVALPTGQAQGQSQNWFDIERSDRASSPYAGGG
jgi:hypothetical protein